MNIVYFSNFINHHQANFSDCLYELTDCNYTFIELCPIYDWLLKGGYSDLSYKPYVLQAWKNEKNMQQAHRLLLDADVVLFAGPEAQKYGVMAAREGKMCFSVGERWLKRGLLNILSPNLIRYLWDYILVLRCHSVHHLCASAFAAKDLHFLHIDRGRYYKWGYFTKVENMPSPTEQHAPNNRIMWCARFLDWKHPELPILMAKRLKDKGYKFKLDMYGSGVLFDSSQQLANDLDVNDVVHFFGNVPNEQIHQSMCEHEIFLFTSDQNEGWGAVANESMSNGCALVGSDAIGSVPFLVNDGVNGLTFKSSSKDSGFRKSALKVDESALGSLCEKVEYLLNQPEERKRMSIAARKTMQDIWSPANAARNLILLINDLKAGRDTSITLGPCSKALPI